VFEALKKDWWCELFKEMVYLGFTVSKDGLCLDPEKIKAMLECLTFHDITIFYKNFIIGFKEICTPRVYVRKYEDYSGACKSERVLRC
jgi:hypothetical protein